MNSKKLEATRDRLQRLNSTYPATNVFLKKKGKTMEELTKEEVRELINLLAEILDVEIESRSQLLIAPTPKTIN
jgi:hypothetical protein